MGSTAASVGLDTAAPSHDTSVNYYVDMMLRGGKTSDANANMNDAAREVQEILAASTTGKMLPGGKAYLSQLVANRTGTNATFLP